MHPLAIARAAVREHGAIQKEQELASFLALLADQPPQVVVEIGSDAGGTLWAWQRIGASHEEGTLQALKDLLGGDLVDLLFIDGDHSYAGVRRDFEMYSPLVADQGMVAFHDICHHPHHPDVGVDMLWRSEEHTSELQSPYDLVCRLLLEKKKKQQKTL